jgi:hypothetical protein
MILSTQESPPTNLLKPVRLVASRTHIDTAMMISHTLAVPGDMLATIVHMDVRKDVPSQASTPQVYSVNLMKKWSLNLKDQLGFG